MEESSTNRLSIQSQLSSVSSVVLGSSLISLSPFFVEFSGLDAVANSFYRMAIGGIVLFFIALLRKKRIPSKGLLGVCFLASLTISLDLVIWNQSVLYIGAGLSTVLANLEIVFLVLIGTFFFREKLPGQFVKMCGLIALGVCCLIHPYFFEIHLNTALGIIFGLGASFVYSIYLLLLKTIRMKHSEISTISMLSTICLMGAASLGAFMVIAPSTSFAVPTWQSFFCIFSNGLLCQVLGWVLITKGLKHVSLALSGLLMLAQPALTFIFDCFFLGRNTHLLQIVGCVILLAAIYGTTREEKKGENLI